MELFTRLQSWFSSVPHYVLTLFRYTSRLDVTSVVQIEKVDRKSLAHSYSRRSGTLTSESNTSSAFAPRPSTLRIEMEDILCLAPTADLSLPPGGAFCIDIDAGPQYLVC